MRKSEEEFSPGQCCDCKDCAGRYILVKDEEDPRLTMFDKPLPCCGCGIGWCSLLLGFVCPLIWYYAAFLYLRKYYNNDPRERGGLAASACALADGQINSSSTCCRTARHYSHTSIWHYSAQSLLSACWLQSYCLENSDELLPDNVSRKGKILFLFSFPSLVYMFSDVNKTVCRGLCGSPLS